MARLKIQEVARAQGLNLSQLHAAVNRRLVSSDPVAMGTIRRYWYSTNDGKADGPPIKLVDVHLLGTIARTLGTPVGELINEDEVGQHLAVMVAA